MGERESALKETYTVDEYRHKNNGAFLFCECWRRLPWDIVLDRVWGVRYDMISGGPEWWL